MMTSPKVGRRVVITGADGFIGQNLRTHLSHVNSVEIVNITREDTQSGKFAETLITLDSDDLIFHLAGVNKPETDDAFQADNCGLTDFMCAQLESRRVYPEIIFSSSTQAERDTPYGASKRQAERRLRRYEERGSGSIHICRLPNVFGKWSRPNYNSAVATFCHNIQNDLPIRIHDAKSPLSLLYVDDLCEQWIEHLRGCPLKHAADGTVILNRIHDTTVGEVAAHIERLKCDRDNLVVNGVGHGLARALHATFLSFAKPEQFASSLERKQDSRGSFTEFLKTVDSGQVSVFTAHPGEVRGGHYHHTKTEKFLVVEGQALFRFRNVQDGAYAEIVCDAAECKVVETVPGWAHDVKNIGKGILVCVLWSSEVFDPQNADTFAFQVSNDEQA